MDEGCINKWMSLLVVCLLNDGRQNGEYILYDMCMMCMKFGLVGLLFLNMTFC